jgi:hypothetical protein
VVSTKVIAPRIEKSVSASGGLFPFGLSRQPLANVPRIRISHDPTDFSGMVRVSNGELSINPMSGHFVASLLSKF